MSDKNTSTTAEKTSKGKKGNKIVPGKDETSTGAEEVNGQLINATGFRENADRRSPDPKTGEAEKGDKNKKTTEGTIVGKEKAKNRRSASLESNEESGGADPKSNQDTPKASKTAKSDKNDNKKSGQEKPKKKSEDSKGSNDT